MDQVNIANGRANLYLGNCLETLKALHANSIDSIVTDPPYGISFMGNQWDYDIPSLEIWRECLRVLKPGGHLISFAGARTQHRMASRIEDAGFEIRDLIAWVYGSGVPKSMDVSKTIDKLDAVEERLERRYRFTEWFVKSCDLTPSQIDKICKTNTMGRHWTDVRPNGKQPDIPTRHHFEKLRPYIKSSIPNWVESAVDQRTVESKNFKRREIVGHKIAKDLSKAALGFSGVHSPECQGEKKIIAITEPATDDAKKWRGWGTALKPAIDPITVARKPINGTVAQNVLANGVGAINIDACRLNEGRWPANFMHDGSDDVIDVLGDAAKFFYCAKVSPRDRGDGNSHPTVKPTDLMRYLCRLVTPPGGIVLDPFMGSGSTGKAAILEGFNFIGCEMNQEFFDVSRARIESALFD